MSNEIRFHRATTVLLTAALLATLTVALTGGQRADAVDGPVEVVYVATGANFPDALAGANLAATVGAPMLTVNTDLPIPDATITALHALDPSQIIILGGPVAVSEPVADALEGYARSGAVTRIEGGDRHATAAQIADALPDKVHDADRLDGLDSTDFLRSGGRASDSDRLAGRAAVDLRIVPLGGWTYHTAGADLSGLTGPALPDGSSEGIGASFIVPAGHEPTDPLIVDVHFTEDTFGACSLRLSTQGVGTRLGGTSGTFVNWHSPGAESPTTDFDTPSGRDNHSLSFTLEPDALPAYGEPGTAHMFVIRRDGAHGADTCSSTMTVVGAQVRY